MADVLRDRKPDVVPYRARMCAHGFLVSVGASCPLCNPSPKPPTGRGANLGPPWSTDEDHELEALRKRGRTYKEIARLLGRSTAGVQERIRRLDGRRPD